VRTAAAIFCVDAVLIASIVFLVFRIAGFSRELVFQQRFVLFQLQQRGRYAKQQLWRQCGIGLIYALDAFDADP
jgi:hypothetical protein